MTGSHRGRLVHARKREQNECANRPLRNKHRKGDDKLHVIVGLRPLFFLFFFVSFFCFFFDFRDSQDSHQDSHLVLAILLANWRIENEND